MRAINDDEVRALMSTVTDAPFETEEDLPVGTQVTNLYGGSWVALIPRMPTKVITGKPPTTVERYYKVADWHTGLWVKGEKKAPRYDEVARLQQWLRTSGQGKRVLPLFQTVLHPTCPQIIDIVYAPFKAPQNTPVNSKVFKLVNTWWLLYPNDQGNHAWEIAGVEKEDATNDVTEEATFYLKVRDSIDKKGGCIGVWVKDNHGGIPQDLKARIEEIPHSRVQPLRSRNLVRQEILMDRHFVQKTLFGK